MAVYLARKEVAALPATLTANTLYFVRRGAGFDIYVTDNTGLLVYKANNTDDPLKSPTFTYTSGNLSQIVYADGSTKTLTYAAGQLTRIDLVRGAVTYRKDFTYSGGNLASITETTL
jgi:hypothetical protein